MDNSFTDIVGYIAAFLTTTAFFPQAWKSWTTRDLSGISLPMYALFTSGVALWLVYGYKIGSLPILIANTITVILSLSILILKIIEIGKADK